MYYYEEFIRFKYEKMQKQKDEIRKEIELYKDMSLEITDTAYETLHYIKQELDEYEEVLNIYKNISLDEMINFYKNYKYRIDKLARIKNNIKANMCELSEGVIIDLSFKKLDKLQERLLLVNDLILMDLLVELCNYFLNTDINDIDFPNFTVKNYEFIVINDGEEIICRFFIDESYKSDKFKDIKYENIFKYEEFSILYNIKY